jgi:cobalt-zinc-cadmium efflux system membrane fusion protein
VTLSSVEMAEAQGNLIVTEREWARVRELGREIVAERRYIEAEVAAQQARARVLAYGMLAEQIETLTRATDASSADGSFTLLSPATGTIVRDDFVVGEAIEPGRMMFEIADESTLWVEARLPARDAATVRVGSPARGRSLRSAIAHGGKDVRSPGPVVLLLTAHRLARGRAPGRR